MKHWPFKVTNSDGKPTVFALAVMEYAVGISKFGKNPKTLLVHQYKVVRHDESPIWP